MNKDDYDEIERFSGLSLFHNTDKQTKLAEQWKNVHWMVKLTRTEEHLLAIKCEPRSRNKNEENIMINSRKNCDEQWKLGSAKTVPSLFPESKVSTERDTTVARQKVHHQSSFGHMVEQKTHLGHRSAFT